MNPEHLKRAEESAARVEDILLHVPDKKVEAAIADYLATQFEQVEQQARRDEREECAQRAECFIGGPAIARHLRAIGREESK